MTTMLNERDHEDLTQLVEALRKILSGIYSFDLANGRLHVRIRPLPGPLVAAGVRQDDGLWLFMDREKPGAVGHARELLKAHPELVVTDGDMGTFLVSIGNVDHRSGDVARFVMELSETADEDDSVDQDSRVVSDDGPVKRLP